ncbi:MAG TPA: hypothetical protein VFR35_18420, partial [Actinoplanes sp.]|nr:hypothetical protein [Actinoplanes sp.]
MADAPVRGRRRLWVVAAVIVGLLAGLGVLPGRREAPRTPVTTTAASRPAPQAGSRSTPLAASRPPPLGGSRSTPLGGSRSTPLAASRPVPPAGSRAASALLALPRTAGQWPGPNGLSGVNGDPVFDTAHVQRFCAARGRPCKLAQTYTDRTTYESMTSGSGWTFEFFDDFPGALVISQGLVPARGEADLRRCAAGEFDAHWRAFGSLMVRHGRGDSIVRLGWEFNERTTAWRATDTQAYIGCYRHAADNIRATNPSVIL